MAEVKMIIKNHPFETDIYIHSALLIGLLAVGSIVFMNSGEGFIGFALITLLSLLIQEYNFDCNRWFVTNNMYYYPENKKYVRFS